MRLGFPFFVLQIFLCTLILYTNVHNGKKRETHVVNVFIKLKIFLDIKCYYCCWLCIPLNISFFFCSTHLRLDSFTLLIQQAFSYSNKYWMIFLRFFLTFLPSFNLFLDFHFHIFFIQFHFFLLSFFWASLSIMIIKFYSFSITLVHLISFLLPLLHIHVQYTRWDMGNGI